MITFPSGYVRLAVDGSETSEAAGERVAHLLRLCRLNDYERALIVCRRHYGPCCLEIRAALRFAQPGSLEGHRLGLVFSEKESALPPNIHHMAVAAGLECQLFADEQTAVHWLTEKI